MKITWSYLISLLLIYLEGYISLENQEEIKGGTKGEKGGRKEIMRGIKRARLDKKMWRMRGER